MSGERLRVWEDPDVVEAFKSGRSADDICVLNCPQCGDFSYYNQGSSFYCKHCEAGWYVCSEDEDPPVDRGWMRPDVILTMEDVAAAECEDYP